MSAVTMVARRRGRAAGWHPTQYLLVAILLGIGLTFRAGLSYFFVQDDFGFLSRLAQVRTPAQWLALFLRNDHFYRPVARVLLLGIPFELFQTSAVGYHVFNLGLHLVNILLVYRLLRALGVAPLSATLGAGVYGFYPAHLTPLVWISGIQELSVALFLLLSSLAFLAWCREPRRLVYYGLSLAGYAAALLCKETAVLLPLWLMVVQWHYLPSGMAIGRRLARSAAALAGLGLVVLGYGAVRLAKANVTGDSGPYSISLAPASLWHNAQVYTLDLYGLHSLPIISAAALTVATAVGLVVLLAALGPQRWRALAGLVWCGGFLAPTLILLDRHYSYYFSVATVGVALLASAVADRIAASALKQSKARRRLTAGALLLALMAWAGYAAARVSEPFDEQSLYAKGERSRQIVADLAAQVPRATACTTLLVSGAAPANEAELSQMFMFFYPSLEQVVFQDQNAAAEASAAGECRYALPAALSLAPVQGWPA
jgi:hypothetical protein